MHTRAEVHACVNVDKMAPYTRGRHKGGAASSVRPQTALLSQTRHVSNPCDKTYTRPYFYIKPKTDPNPLF